MCEADPKILKSILTGELKLTRPATKEEMLQWEQDEAILEILEDIHDLHARINQGEIAINDIVNELEKLKKRTKTKIEKIGEE